MFFLKSSYQIKITLIVLLTLTALGSLLYTQYIISEIRTNERSSVELWAKAMEYNSKPHYQDTRDDLRLLIQELSQMPLLSDQFKKRWLLILERAESDLANSSLDFVASELIIKNRFQIPSVVVDEGDQILHFRNIDDRRVNSSLVAEFAGLNDPIELLLDTGSGLQIQKVYYGESAIITTLKLFPFIQFGLLSLFMGIGYLALSSIKKNEQSNLWVGMAKEAAHQLGTPLSSLYGWVEIIKDQNADPAVLNVIHELQNDLDRVQIVTERFNKIGSSPELHRQRVQPVLERVSSYLERRLPRFGKNIALSLTIDVDARLMLNTELFAWAIENILKNAVDAIDANQPDSIVSMHAYQKNNKFVIDISDSGKGIEKKFITEIFTPGFSTKVRGWGLGLSLTRRIIEDYHNGKVTVAKSSLGQGTQFRITLPLPDEEGLKS